MAQLRGTSSYSGSATFLLVSFFCARPQHLNSLNSPCNDHLLNVKIFNELAGSHVDVNGTVHHTDERRRMFWQRNSSHEIRINTNISGLTMMNMVRKEKYIKTECALKYVWNHQKTIYLPVCVRSSVVPLLNFLVCLSATFLLFHIFLTFLLSLFVHFIHFVALTLIKTWWKIPCCYTFRTHQSSPQYQSF